MYVMAHTELQYVAGYFPVIATVIKETVIRINTIKILMFTNTKMNVYPIQLSNTLGWLVSRYYMYLLKCLNFMTFRAESHTVHQLTSALIWVNVHVRVLLEWQKLESWFWDHSGVAGFLNRPQSSAFREWWFESTPTLPFS